MEKSREEFLKNSLKLLVHRGSKNDSKIFEERVQGKADKFYKDYRQCHWCYYPDASFRVMLAGHCDEVGLMVEFINDQGTYIFPLLEESILMLPWKKSHYS